MASFPDGWESDFDGQRWFYKYKPTGFTQYHFPKAGDESLDISEAPNKIIVATSPTPGRLGTINANHFETRSRFKSLLTAIKEPAALFTRELSDIRVLDEYERYKVWAGNLGAHHPPQKRVSLDYRLRDAAFYKQRVIEVLIDLQDSLKKAFELVEGMRTPWEELSGSSSEDDEVTNLSLTTSSTTPTVDYPHRTISAHKQAESGKPNALATLQKLNFSTPAPHADLAAMPLVLRPLTSPGLDAPNEASEVYGGIQRMIYHLYRLANIIRSSTQIDRFARGARINVSSFRSYDEQHVKAVFPFAALYLRTRLLEANTRRRKLLRYNADHQARLAEGQEAEVDQAVSTEEEPSLLPPNTEATEFKMRQGDEADLDSSDTRSVAETISSIAFSEATRETIRLPFRPLDQDGNPSTDFQCPFCCVIVHVPNNSAWIKHVFRDLGAYVCTFERCPMSSQMFESRTSWFNHEMDLHRKQWQCNTTGHLTYSEESAFRRHLAEQHKNWISSSHSQSIINSCEQRRTPEYTECPFCRVPRQISDDTNSHDDIGDPTMIPAARLKQHLAQHMERLALFTLPRTCFDLDDEESCASAMAIPGSDGSGSNRSEILGSIAFSSDDNQEDAIETSSDTGAKKATTTEETKATTETQSKAETGSISLRPFGLRRPKWPDARSSCGHEIQTTRLGRKKAWWAYGPAVEKFHQDIQPEINTILNNLHIQDSEISIRVYMIGKSEETSSPTIFVCCTNLSVARRVKESLLSSPVIGNNAFALGSSKFPLEQLVPGRKL